MQHIISLFVIVSLHQLTICKPINNGFTLKLNPIFVKDDDTKTFDAFAKDPQESSHATGDVQREILSEAYSSHSTKLGCCTKQIAKTLFPFKDPYISVPLDTNYIHIPVINQPFEDYKLVVATAPFGVRIAGADAKPLVVYVVFPHEEVEDTHNIQVPTIYFVRKPSEIPYLKNHKVDPVLIIDSNRTVTGLKSNEIAKYIKFRNKLRNLYSYDVAR